MTMFQSIICMALLALLVGLAIWFDWKTSKNNSSEVDIVEKRPLTKENVENTLKELGATDFEYTDDGSLFFRDRWDRYILDTSIAPTVKLLAGYDLEEDFDLNLAKKVADNANKDTMGIYIRVHDDRQIVFATFSTAASCHTLKEILPYMAVYLEEGRLRFIRLYTEAAKGAERKKALPKSKKIVCYI